MMKDKNHEQEANKGFADFSVSSGLEGNILLQDYEELPVCTFKLKYVLLLI